MIPINACAYIESNAESLQRKGLPEAITCRDTSSTSKPYSPLRSATYFQSPYVPYVSQPPAAPGSNGTSRAASYAHAPGTTAAISAGSPVVIRTPGFADPDAMWLDAEAPVSSPIRSLSQTIGPTVGSSNGGGSGSGYKDGDGGANIGQYRFPASTRTPVQCFPNGNGTIDAAASVLGYQTSAIPLFIAPSTFSLPTTPLVSQSYTNNTLPLSTKISPTTGNTGAQASASASQLPSNGNGSSSSNESESRSGSGSGVAGNNGVNNNNNNINVNANADNTNTANNGNGTNNSSNNSNSNNNNNGGNSSGSSSGNNASGTNAATNSTTTATAATANTTAATNTTTTGATTSANASRNAPSIYDSRATTCIPQSWLRALNTILIVLIIIVILEGAREFSRIRTSDDPEINNERLRIIGTTISTVAVLAWPIVWDTLIGYAVLTNAPITLFAFIWPLFITGTDLALSANSRVAASAQRIFGLSSINADTSTILSLTFSVGLLLTSLANSKAAAASVPVLFYGLIVLAAFIVPIPASDPTTTGGFTLSSIQRIALNYALGLIIAALTLNVSPQSGTSLQQAFFKICSLGTTS